jgi:NTE family protein
MPGAAELNPSPTQTIVPVLAGGGTRLPAHVGVLTALRDMDYGYKHIVGVSGGSVVAALAAFGKTPEHMRQLFRDVDFSQFRGYSLINLLLRGGLSNGKRFERWLASEIGDVCFKDCPVELHVVATDVRSGQPVIFNRHNSPDLKVVRAVLYSISIPLLFPFHHYGRHVLTDGSILAEDGLFRDWAGDRTPVFCFRLRDNRVAAEHPARKILPVADYMFMLMRTFMSTLSREYMTEALWLNTVLIQTEGMSPLEFHMTPGQKNSLFDSGYNTTRDYLPTKLARQMAD